MKKSLAYSDAWKNSHSCFVFDVPRPAIRHDLGSEKTGVFVGRVAVSIALFCKAYISLFPQRDGSLHGSDS